MDSERPSLSVIIICPNAIVSGGKTLRHLRAQTARNQLEIVLVAPANKSDCTGFNWVRYVASGPMESTAAARAAGVRAASAPVVAFVEDHAFPHPRWAEALIAAHRQPCAAVGPAIVNGNPRRVLSWVNLIIEYGPWLDPVPAGPAEHLPGHNSSYKRDALLQYGDRLEAMLDAESILHWDLRAHGQQLLLEPAAKTFHVNITRWPATVILRFCGGRLFATARARHWPLGRRLFYGLGAPLIPLVRFARLMGRLPRTGRPVLVAPLLLVALALDAAGETVGYLAGRGAAMRILTDMEFHRERYLDAEDQRRFLAEESRLS